MRGWDIDQALASRAFDYVITDDPEVEMLLAEGSKLVEKGRKCNIAEKKRYGKIKKLLKDILRVGGHTIIEQDVQDELYNEMKKRTKQLERKLFQ